MAGGGKEAQANMKETDAGFKFKIFNHLLKKASDTFSYLLKMMINLLSLSI